MEERKRKREEAVARGQISVDDPALLRGKRPRHDKGAPSGSSHSQHRENMYERGRGRGRGRGTDGGWRGRGRGGLNSISRDDPEVLRSKRTTLPLPQPPGTTTQDLDDGSDDDGPPEVITSKPPSALVDHISSSDEDAGGASENRISPQSRPEVAPVPSIHSTGDQSVKPVKKPRPAQPKKAPYNPFASRPTLLRNVSSPLSPKSLVYLH